MSLPHTFDLHLHSNFSDGDFSLSDLFSQCKTQGLKTIAVADHDTLDHILPSQEQGKNQGIRVIPALELSVGYEDKSPHILGYYIDVENKALRSLLQNYQDERKKRVKSMAERLAGLGFFCDTEQIFQKPKGSVGRLALAKAVIKDKRNENKLQREGISDAHVFIERYLIPGAPAYVDRSRVSLLDGVKVIHEAGGIAVWAHPFLNEGSPLGDLLPVWVRIFKKAGLRGLEVFSSQHSFEETKELFKLCKEHELLMTAGSDFHGPSLPSISGVGGWKDYGIEWKPDKRFLG